MHAQRRAACKQHWRQPLLRPGLRLRAASSHLLTSALLHLPLRLNPCVACSTEFDGYDEDETVKVAPGWQAMQTQQPSMHAPLLRRLVLCAEADASQRWPPASPGSHVLVLPARALLRPALPWPGLPGGDERQPGPQVSGGDAGSHRHGGRGADMLPPAEWTALQHARPRAQQAGEQCRPPAAHSLRVHRAATLCVQELSRRITVAMQEAHGKSVVGMKEKMKDLAKSLGLPNPGALTGGGMGM